jgi:trimethylamine--corrinoid protein Co-methyltransferase
MFAGVLSSEQVERIRNVSLEILERVGVLIPHEEMLRRFADAGATVDFPAQRVRIPPELVVRSVSQAGKRFTLYGRELERRAEFGCGKRNYNSVGGEALWIDGPGGERRYATLADVTTAARFADALAMIHIVGAMADAHDIPASLRPVENLAALIKNTTKPVVFWFYDRASTTYLVEMLVALRGDAARARQYPLCYPFLEPISPLRFPFYGVDLLFETARLDLPVAIGPMAQMGMSAPATVAGTLALENAEILAGICLTQLVRAGTPVLYSGICHAFDMATTQLIFSGPEQAIFGVAMTELGKSYGLPVEVNTGLTDSKRVDAQAGLESGLSLMLAAAAGADKFGHLGISGVDQAASLDVLVFQHEVISFVESVMREIDFGDQALALEEIAEVGPGGRFIDREHTARHFRRELWLPKLLDRQYYQPWLEGGALSTEQRCRSRCEHILKTHVTAPIDPELERALDEIVATARRHLPR